jgi:hypothetical protein
MAATAASEGHLQTDAFFLEEENHDSKKPINILDLTSRNDGH